ncbi:MAG: DegT/DnrJ/EryC1/StrS family aminotransferase [Chloroflexi bacterium]|nr:DegT/DnrJ/EryC1/StrS family aminotransferase [Chloroflexota bacterium]
MNALAPGVASIRQELDAAIGRVLDSGWFLMGPETTAFEREFAAYHSLRESVGVGTGTDAVRIGLRALEVGDGDEVLVPANAGVPPVAAVLAAGARPVFCDVDPNRQAVPPDEVERRAGPRTRALVLVHLYGQPASIQTVDAARARGLVVLEDCAQAHGARTLGRRVGTLGDAAAFSFYPTKNLAALGDGGLVLSADGDVIERARVLRQYGWRTKYVSELQSVVSRLDELQAAVLRVKLQHLDRWNRTRRELADRYRAALADVPEVTLPPAFDGDEAVHHLFVVRTERRDELRAALKSDGITTDVHYPLPAHLQAPYRQFGEGPGSLPETERLARQVLSLPLYPELAPVDLEYVADRVRAFFGR